MRNGTPIADIAADARVKTKSVAPVPEMPGSRMAVYCCTGASGRLCSGKQEKGLSHMSDAPSTSNRTVPILLGVIAVLLVVLILVLAGVFKGSSGSSSANTAASGASTSTANPGVGSSGGAFDPATATKVPAGQQPEAFVKAYYQAILDKKWDVAFKMQPAASQQGTVQDFQQTEQMYGLKSFGIVSAVSEGATATVVVRQDLGKNGVFGAQWTFVKPGSQWLVKQRDIAIGDPATAK